MFSELDESALIERAGEGAFERGLSYYRNGHVTELHTRAGKASAIVMGTSIYGSSLWWQGERLVWDCDCPAAEEGDFCKHLVAVALAAGVGEQAPAQPDTLKSAGDDDLLTALRAQSTETLASWLHELASNDPVLEQSLRARLSLVSPSALKEILRNALNTGGFLDYRRSMDFADQLDGPLALLEDILETEPAECAALCEYAVKRLLTVYGRADDSSGAIGEQTHRFAELHARAIRQSGKGGRKLATTLYKLKIKDEWGLFPLEAYWETLGDAGQRQYADKVEQDYAALPPATRDRAEAYRSGEFGVLRRREELAYQRGELDVLEELYGRSLPHGFGYVRIIEACRHFGYYDRARAWAEEGVRENPRDSRLLEMLAEEYERAGLHEQAMASLWEAFRRSPFGSRWQSLKAFAGDDWPAWREQALSFLAALETELADGRRNISDRLMLLMGDDEIDAAVQLAREQAAHPQLLQRLAEVCRDTHPGDAAAFLRRCVDVDIQPAESKRYPALVRLMKQARDLDPGADTETWLRRLREQYGRRPALMSRMDKAGL